ncbi:diacylglycerol/lipid kinase family protein [Jeotgalibaca dankookensis]|uniref:diacylglycerol/lipid kinase family protein n=1 Tax=Jeotgalibaca dankookensis TaxID=708126 RepID=UPI000782FF93|nr:diacylglycerol kinase family protein [Jeotgalibaca dankookensis]
MTHALLIVNPTSGGEKAKDYAKDMEATLTEMYDQVTVKHTEKAGDATRFAKQATQDRLTAVFAMGGDGTINETVNGLAEQEYRPVFGFIPMGTVNNLGRSLGISMDPQEAIANLKDSVEKKMDIGKINDRYFIDIVGIGEVPRAVQQVDIEEKTKLGPLAYFIEGAKALGEKKMYDFNIEIDGESIQEVSMVVVMSLSNSIGGFENVLPEASAYDGRLHFMLLKGDKIIDKVSLVPKIFSGQVAEDERIIYRAFEKAHLALTDGTELKTNVDGDEGPALPIDVSVLEHHLTVLVPKSQ